MSISPAVEAARAAPEIARLLPYHFAKEKRLFPARARGDAIEVWVCAGEIRAESLAEARRILAAPLVPVAIERDRFEQCLALAYSQGEGATSDIVTELTDGFDLEQLAQELPEIVDLLEAEDDAPMVRLINALLTEALRQNASDIHIEQYEGRSAVRFRVDGALRPVLEPQRELHAALVSRVKVMANLDIAEKRLPQDGRITLRVAGRPVDVRVSTLPAARGERVVLRLLDKQAARLDLAGLGMGEDTLHALDTLIHEPHGIVLVTGPTGSGKTTTLYAALSRLDRSVHNMMTVEDPIEYELDGISQTQVNPRIDMTFARALRAILRQDPDVVMIGEIRDLETAQIAVQASLTGHLVLATLHTNDAAGAVTRLIDMGIEPFLLASSLIGVMAQRLVRRLCIECRLPDAAAAGDTTIYTAAGCERCGWSGYRERTGIYELMLIDATLRCMIHDARGEPEVREYLARRGMANLRGDGMRWVRAGVTSLEEVLRVTREGADAASGRD